MTNNKKRILKKIEPRKLCFEPITLTKVQVDKLLSRYQHQFFDKNHGCWLTGFPTTTGDIWVFISSGNDQ